MPKPRHIIHVDMDAFYASVEQLDNPDLKGKPIIVGGSAEERGVVAAASYEVRKYGIHSAMPTARALKLCPDLIILPVRMARYAEVSQHIRRIFSEYTPDIEPLSLDEAFLDVTNSVNLFGPAEKIAREIKNQIKQQLSLTASVGVAPNKFLAKLASDLDKPDGFVVISENNKQRILDPLPVSRVWGVGKVTAKALHSRGIETIEQLQNTPLKTLQTILGNQAEDIQKLAQGIDDRPVISQSEPKSISKEETFAQDIIDKTTLLNTLHNQVEQVAQALREERLQGCTITLKLRYKNFKTITRSHTLELPTDITAILYQQAKDIFEKWYQASAGELRLLGFGVSGLIKQGTGQQLLFSDPHENKHTHVDRVYDQIKQKYGPDALKRGR